jgi:hypothetical protein
MDDSRICVAKAFRPWQISRIRRGGQSKGSGFKFFSEPLEQFGRAGATMCKLADVLANRDWTAHMKLLSKPGVRRLSRLFEIRRDRHFPDG